MQTNMQSLLTKIKNAFNTKYLNTTTGIYGNGIANRTQCAACNGDWFPNALKAKVAANLAKRVEADS